MADTESRTDALTGDEQSVPAAAPARRGYGEWDGYSTAKPVTVVSAPPKAEDAKPVPAKNNPAEWMFDRLIRMIADYEKGLSEDEEIGGRLVGAPGEGSFHIDDIGFWGPDMIMFYGKNSHGRPVRLIQHYTQLSVLLTSMPKEKEKPRRIGFALRERVEEAAAKPVEAAPAEEGAVAEVEAHPS